MASYFQPRINSLHLITILAIFTVASCAPKTLAPGKVVSHSFLETGVYLGSPSIAVMPNGDYVASFDTFGPMTLFGKNGTFVFSSKNKGMTWEQLAFLPRLGSATLFIHENALHLMGTLVSTQNDDLKSVAIYSSVDSGMTWSDPVDSDTGLLLSDGKTYYTAPVPVVLYQGRIWRTMEDQNGTGDWPEHFRTFMMSAPADANLMKAENWTISNELYGNDGWLNGEFEGWLEGNAVVDRQGNIVSLLRVHEPQHGGVAAIASLADNGQSLKFNPQNDFIKMPGGTKKFTVRYDEESKSYWSLTNYVVQGDLRGDKTADQFRNTVALVRSRDLRNWNVKEVLLHDEHADTRAVQYIDWVFDGTDIVAVARTTWEDEEGEPKNATNSNYITFHRFKNFRQ